MSTCSILNENTKEPKIYFKTDRGDVFEDLVTTLNNSDNNYEIGFKDITETFQSRASVPIMDNSTTEGIVQNLIKNEYLKPNSISYNTFEAVDELAAEYVEESLILNHYDNYIRNGNSFTIGNFKPFIDAEKYPDLAEIDSAMNEYVRLQNEQTTLKKPVKYSEEQLMNKIMSFMNSMGFNVGSIEAYKKSYRTKFGIDPNAKAFIDFANKMIAFKDGEIKLEDLSEEFSHFVVEMWDQSEIERMLQSVNNTKEYSEHAEHYRQLYSKQLSDPTLLEKAVRREVLGKMLSNAVQSNFSTIGRTETEKTFFEKFKDILTKFFNYITGRLTTDLENSINDMAKDIANGLYNDNLEQLLKQEQFDPILQIMYSANNIDEKQMRELAKQMSANDFQVKNAFEKSITEILNTFIMTSGSAITELENLPEDGVISTFLHSTVERLNSTHDIVSLIGERIRKIDINSIKSFEEGNPDYSRERLIEFKTNVQNKIDKISSNMNRMNGIFKDIQDEGDPIKVAGSNHDFLSPNSTEEEKDRILNHAKIGVNALQKDINKFWSYFVPAGKVSNIFVVQFQGIVARMRTAFQAEFLKDITNLILPLKEKREQLKEFVKSGRLITTKDTKKVNKENRRYELEILKELLPDEYNDKTIEEYTKEWEENGLPEIVKNRHNVYFFQYQYLYRKNIANNKAVDKEDIDKELKFIESIEKHVTEGNIWDNTLFQDLILESTGNRKVSDIISRREKTSPFTVTGEIKEGLRIVTYGQAKQAVKANEDLKKLFVSINPNHALFEYGNTNEPRDSDPIFQYDPSIETSNRDGQISYEYMAWGRTLKENQKDNNSTIIDNYRKAYDDYKRLLELQGISDKPTIQKKMMEWAQNEILFENSAEYWENFNPDNTGIDFDNFYKQPISNEHKLKMDDLRKDYDVLKMRRGLILKKHKSPKDYKEIDINSITPTDKMELDNIEKSLSEKRKEMKMLFTEYGLKDEMYKQSNDVSNVRLNKSYKELIKSVIGKSFEDASAEELRKFFLSSDGIRSNSVLRYNSLIKELDSGVETDNIDKYRKAADKMGLGESRDSIIKAFFVENSPIWAKRYDSTNGYDIFLTELEKGNINMESLLDDFRANPDGKVSFVVNGHRYTLDTMSITPSYRHIVPYQRPLELLIKEYELETDNKKKFDLIQEMVGANNVNEDFKVDLSHVYTNADKLETYIQMWDVQITRLKKDFHGNDIKDLRRYNVDIIPQARRTNVERTYKLFGGKFKPHELKDWLIEEYTFREDDEEYAYQTTTIPRYGYRLISDEERTDDIYHAMVWGLKNANTRKQRVIHRDMAVRTMQALESQNFGNKNAKDTNYHKMTKESMDYNFYGKSTTFHKEISIGLMKDKDGNPVRLDLGKIAVWFRHLSVKAALKFSPITAFTNFTSGWTNNILMSLVGYDIYGNSNMRAFKTMNALMPGTITDVGEFDYQAKANKIMYAFGYHDMEERFRDARFPKPFRILNDLGFAPMALTNYPLELQTILAKIMEYRLVDGKFIDWKTYKRIEKTKNPSLSADDIKRQFDSLSTQSAYDFLDENAQFDIEKLSQAGYNGNIDIDKSLMMNAIRSITEKTTMEIRDINEGAGLRDPRLAFFTSMKKWMILASVNVFSGYRYDYDVLGEEKGIGNTLVDSIKMFKEVATKEKTLKESYNDLSEIDKVNMRRGMAIGSVMLTSFLIASMLKGWADDDDEKDNYLLQTATYMALRNLNELAGSSTGIIDSYYQAVKEPFMAAQTLKNYSEVLNFDNYGETIEQGKYQGINKGVAAIMKASWLKNLYNVGVIPMGEPTSAEIMKQNYGSYEHFNTQDSLYTIFSLLPNEEEDEK